MLIGIIGNVALDAARLILKGNKALESTDMTDRAIKLLKKSSINEVHIFGRRGPTQASFTNKELREMYDIENCEVIIAEEDITQLTEASKQELDQSRTHKRMIQLMLKRATLISKQEMIDRLTSQDYTSDDAKKCYIHFYTNPVQYSSHEKSSKVDGIVLERTSLSGEASAQRAIGTGEKVHFNGCGLVLESIGYYPIPILGVTQSTSVSHFEGRMLNKEGQHLEGMYASGWFKRGPSGIIGTNVWDAQETARSIIDDLISNKIPLNNRQPFYAGLEDLLDEKQLTSHVISWKDWMKIESSEEARGASMTPIKPREKFVTAEEMKSLLL